MLALGVGLVLVAACTGGPGQPPPTVSSEDESVAAPPSPPAAIVQARTSRPSASAVVVPDGTPAATAVAVSRELFARAPVAVLAAADSLPAAAEEAVRLGSPLLLAGDAATATAIPDDELVAGELTRLGVTTLLVIGAASPPPGIEVDVVRAEPVPARSGPGGTTDPVPVPVEPSETVEPVGASGSATGSPDLPRSLPSFGPADHAAGVTPTPAPASGASAGPGAGELPRTEHPDPQPGVALLLDPATPDDAGRTAARATAAAAGTPVVEVPGADPRASADAVAALAGTTQVVALGSAFGDPGVLAGRLASVATGTQLPGGGQLVFPAVPGLPGKKYVALYGTPGTPALGVLGEQDIPGTLARAEQTAAPFRALTGDTVVPTLEIIATIASAGPGPDGSYSTVRPVDELRPMVEAAGQAGMLVILDLQPGRTDFLTQAQQYAELLELPYVGLALDPEWRLAPDQVHLRQIGSVGVDEVNAVGDWLAQLTRDHALPQKVFLLHQFSLRMITERERLDVSHDELAVMIHADGQGSQPAKAGTWNALRAGAPPVHWGWKNFYDEDQPMLDPTQTYQVQPTPDLVTYQ